MGNCIKFVRKSTVNFSLEVLQDLLHLSLLYFSPFSRFIQKATFYPNFPSFNISLSFFHPVFPFLSFSPIFASFQTLFHPPPPPPLKSLTLAYKRPRFKSR